MTDGSISDWSRWWTRGSRPGLGLTDPAHPTNIIRKISKTILKNILHRIRKLDRERERRGGRVWESDRQTDKQTELRGESVWRRERDGDSNIASLHENAIKRPRGLSFEKGLLYRFNLQYAVFLHQIDSHLYHSFNINSFFHFLSVENKKKQGISIWRVWLYAWYVSQCTFLWEITLMSTSM